MQLTTLVKKSYKGFTLIELLVVIAIIGLLSTIVAAPVQSARKKAKDTKKVAEIKQMQTALANYANDNGQYPSASSSAAIYPTLTSLTPAYMSAIPTSVGPTVTNARDKTFYSTVRSVPVGASTSTAGYKTFGYHLAATLEVFNTVLNDDADCWGVVSTTTGQQSGLKNGTACHTYVSASSTAPNSPAYFGNGVASSTFAGPVTGTAGSVLSNVLSQTGIGGTTFWFDQYNWLSHPQAPSNIADIQGYGVNEVASSTCSTIDMCVFDVADSY
jgi:prepilin-type N-terminal cleavage/methylation domain-containing protein